MVCYFCEEERESWTGYYCDACANLRRTVLLYGKRVHEVVDNVLIRSAEQQSHKIKAELKHEIDNKTYNLRSKCYTIQQSDANLKKKKIEKAKEV